MAISCDTRTYYEYDENDDAWYCGVDMDEDDFGRVLEGRFRECPYYQNDDEYAVVRHQM